MPSSLPFPFRRARVNIQSFQTETDSIRSLPQLIDFNASQNPDHPFCVQARKQTKHPLPDLLIISHQQLKQAVLNCSEWLMTNIAELVLPFPSEGTALKGSPIALFLESDFGLLVYKLALISLGVPVLLLSARLSPVAIHHLLVKTAAKAIIVSPRLKNLAEEGLLLFSPTGDPSTLYAQNNYELFLSQDPDTTYSDQSVCIPGHYIGESDRNVLILHSSGTTGLPKPVYTSHRYLLSFTTCHEFCNGEEALGLNLSTLPLYHGYGLLALGLSLGVGKTFCIPAPVPISTGSSIVELLRISKAKSLMSVPSILEEISILPDKKGLEALAPLDFIAFGGGLLKTVVGEKLAAGDVRLINHYGTTETGPLAPIFVPKCDYDWRYFRLRKDLDLRVELESSTTDGVQLYSLIMHPFGWDTTFQVQDQLIRNPKNPTRDFNAIGRNDDLILLATGEKVMPHILEASLSESELVAAAIAVGDGQLELSIIVQPSKPLQLDQYDYFKTAIWSLIVEAGDRMDAHARISSIDAIIIVPFDTLLPRSDKGSIMRKIVNKMLQAEIAKAYQRLENSVSNGYFYTISLDNLEQDVKFLIQTRLNWRIPAEEWLVNDDLFELGMDSLQAAQLRRFILGSLSNFTNSFPVAERIGRDFVYKNPSVTKIANALRASDEFNEIVLTRQEMIAEFVEQYMVERPELGKKSDEGFVVLLTGTTGSLGAFLLAHLASLPSTARVICLNRPSLNVSSEADPYTQQLNSVEAKGIAIPQSDRLKIEVLQSNAALPSLGLEDAKYSQLCGQITHILHSAWPMDFKMQLSSFSTQFAILRNILHLSRDVHILRPLVKPRLLFVSSLAVVGQYSPYHGGLIPEVPINDVKFTNSIGYAEAKLVCEKILQKAALDYATQIEVSYVRVGQISGAKGSGFWNTKEHLAALIKSSQELGSLPILEGTFSWIPVDSAAESLSELLLASRPMELVHHLENPTRQSWHDTLVILASKLNLTLLPFNDWLEKVCLLTDKSPDQNPAKKLAGFFKTEFRHMACGNVILDTMRMRGFSETLRGMNMVGQETVVSYVDYWKSIGFLKES